MNDSEFERILLQSARADAPPGDARQAWARLSGRLGSVGAALVTGDGRRVPEASPIGPLVARGPSWPGRGARTVALKWMLVGALGGSALTAAVLIRARPGQTDAATSVVAPAAIAPTEVTGAAGPPSPPIARDVARAAILTKPLAAPGRHPRHAGRGHGRALRDANDDAGGPKVSDSALAAEVARIDAARTANAGGEYDEAIWLIDRYHRDFPDGALAPDAEVVALEAVAAKRDRPETARRAALFLSRYPDDPHAARVKWLTAHRGVDQP